uniref:MCF.2 cell line derived transforming sequence-like 2 n=1 Tax=Oryzias latipes TaxID=8090 RepID=A0A3P9J2G1_ORYLA
MLCWLKEDEMSVQELLQRVQCVITHVDEIMQQDIRPLLAVDIIEQLHLQFALLSGGRGKDGAPIIIFPEYSGFSEVPEEDFLNVVTYLTSIPSLDAASIGFIIIMDRRKDKWSSVRGCLSRIAGAFPGHLQLVLVLRPSRFFHRTVTDIGIKMHKDDFKMKIVMLNSLSDLHGYVDKSQLTRELGGSLDYNHSQWMHHRTAIENFAMTVKSTAQMLQRFGNELAETDLPQDVQSTKDLLAAHTDRHNHLKDELKLALRQGSTLSGCIKEQAAKSENHELNPDETENQTTVERLMAQLDETDNAFEQFWSKHHLKLEQCLQLRHFEKDFREVKVTLDGLMNSVNTLADTADCAARVELLLKDLKALEDKARPSLEKAQLQALHGDQLIQSSHYAVDSIRPKCVELRRVCDDFSNEVQKKHDVLSKSLQIHRGIDKVNQWCESGIYLLASQAVDKCQSQEGAESALTDIENFLESAEKNQLTELKNLHNQFEMVLSEDLKGSVQMVLKRLEDVQEMFEKRHLSLKRLSAKQTRPIQPVAPRPDSSPKRPSLRNPPRATGSPQSFARRAADNSHSGRQAAEVDPNKKKNTRKTKAGIKIEVMHEESQGGSAHVVAPAESEESLSSRRRHIMTELIETERIYVEELQSIMEGYYVELNNSEFSHLIPPSLENKRDVLFGNLPEIYDFHNKTFLMELENCVEKPELVGSCFLNREMLKCSKDEGMVELEEALATVIDIIKSVNDSMHQIAITGFDGNLSELGKLLMQGSFNVWTDHKKVHSKVKDLARFKPMQRHLFLYNKMLLFCKKREDATEGYEKTPSYSFKHSLKMSAVGITENVKGDSKKFEVWYNGREEVYIIQASSMEVKNIWVSEIRKVLTGQLEACREASQLNIYSAPIRNVRKMALRQSDSSSPELGFRRTNPGPNTRQKKADTSAGRLAHSAGNARKHFSLQALSNRRSLPAEPAAKEAEVPRRFSLTSSLASSSSISARRTKGSLSASIKSKRHEIKSDPTPFGYEDTLNGAIAAARKRQSMTGSTGSGAGGTPSVPRSTSQPGCVQQRLLSMDTEDFETIPSSAEESSNSSEEDSISKNRNSSQYRVQLTYTSCEARDLSLGGSDLVPFLEETENGN